MLAVVVDAPDVAGVKGDVVVDVGELGELCWDAWCWSYKALRLAKWSK